MGTKNHPGAYARIPLRNRRRVVVAYALVDTEDEESVLSVGSWHLSNRGYVRHSMWSGGWREGRMTSLLLHRFVLGLPAGRIPNVDHKNFDRRDCRKANLRVATASENKQNQAGPRSGSASRFRGVSWAADRRKWRASGTVDGRRVQLGSFDNEEAAGRAAAEWRRVNMPFSQEAMIDGN